MAGIADLLSNISGSSGSGYGLGQSLGGSGGLSGLSGLSGLGEGEFELKLMEAAKSMGLDKDSTGLGAGLGMNIGTAQLGLGGLQALMGMFGASKANKLAKDQFKFTKDVTNTNLANQIQSYNTALTDRSNTRAVMEGRDQSSSDKYIEQNRLRR